MIRRTFSAPATDVLATVDVRKALRIRQSAEDDILARKFSAAVELVESRTTKILRRQTIELTLDAWPCGADGIDLPVFPVREVVSLEHRNAAGAWVEVPGADYDWRKTETGGEVYLFSSYSIPSGTTEHRDQVRVVFEAGYEPESGTGTGDDPELTLPDRAIELCLLLAGHWFEHREAVTDGETAEVPLAAKLLFQELRIFR